MKKLLIIGILFYSCYSDGSEEVPSEDYTIRTIDGCEYIQMYQHSYMYVLTHKGNCSNPKHYFKDNNQYKYVIDLPEEYSLVTTSSLHPDTLTGYISRDTLYIGFLNKK
jgi:hypothetical protein